VICDPDGSPRPAVRIADHDMNGGPPSAGAGAIVPVNQRLAAHAAGAAEQLIVPETLP